MLNYSNSDNAVRNLGINRNFFCLLLSDATKYKIAAGITLKSLYPKLFHVTCVAHVLHNCAMKIKPHFEDVDQMMESAKYANDISCLSIFNISEISLFCILFGMFWLILQVSLPKSSSWIACTSSLMAHLLL